MSEERWRECLRGVQTVRCRIGKDILVGSRLAHGVTLHLTGRDLVGDVVPRPRQRQRTTCQVGRGPESCICPNADLTRQSNLTSLEP